METDKIDILKGPSKEKMERIYKSGNRKNVRFEIHYGMGRTACVNILEILSVPGETVVKILASMPAGFFMYSQGEDPRPNQEKSELIRVNIFYTTNTRKGYIEKIPKEEIKCSLNTQKEEPKVCPRCKGRKVDPYYISDCRRCGGVGTVTGHFVPDQFID